MAKATEVGIYSRLFNASNARDTEAAAAILQLNYSEAGQARAVEMTGEMSGGSLNSNRWSNSRIYFLDPLRRFFALNLIPASFLAAVNVPNNRIDAPYNAGQSHAPGYPRGGAPFLAADLISLITCFLSQLRRSRNFRGSSLAARSAESYVPKCRTAAA